MSEGPKFDAGRLRMLAVDLNETDARILERVAYQLDIEAKRYEESEKLQEIGKSAMESIAEMVAALDCDYERLEELREMRDTFKASTGKRDDIDAQRLWDAQYDEEADELVELEKAAGECKDRDEANERIQQDPLSLQVRSGWYTPGNRSDSSDHEPAEEFEILLSTGGPATRIIGELDESGEPTRARLQAQDWGTVWTDYVQADQDTLLSYCRCFYFGEG